MVISMPLAWNSHRMCCTDEGGVKAPCIGTGVEDCHFRSYGIVAAMAALAAAREDYDAKSRLKACS